MSQFVNDIQKLQPGERIMLFEVDGSKFGADVLRFHAHRPSYSETDIQAALDAGTELGSYKPIIWQGEEYTPWPVELKGVDINSDGSPTSPTLTVGNLDGTIAALCIAYQNMEDAKVTIHHTTAKYLDAENFTSGNPDADPTQEAIDVFFIDRKGPSNRQSVQFMLSSPDSVGNQQIGRQMTPYCEWCQRGQYRGADCGYNGTAMFDDDDNPTIDPTLDQCSGTVTGCKLRFGEDAELPHGGFTAVRMIK